MSEDKKSYRKNPRHFFQKCCYKNWVKLFFFIFQAKFRIFCGEYSWFLNVFFSQTFPAHRADFKHDFRDLLVYFMHEKIFTNLWQFLCDAYRFAIIYMAHFKVVIEKKHTSALMALVFIIVCFRT